VIRIFRIVALPLLAAGVSLFAGLMPTLLRTGRVEPLDWLLPAYVALVAMMLAAGRGGGRLHWSHTSLYAALVLLPPLLVSGYAAATLPWMGMALLAALLTGAGVLAFWAMRQPGRKRWSALLIGLLLLGGVRIADNAGAEERGVMSGAELGVMTALPLFAEHAGESGGAGDGLMAVGGKAPLLVALGAQARPIDVIDAAALTGLERLLLAQPRLLAPQELVALDGWVREGGQVAILADPYLHWPDGHAPGDPARAPLTSLLDPLLTHWGLTLEPARIDPAKPVERHVLRSGALLQLAGASRFTRTDAAPCTVEEAGLIARCAIGKGRATLIADADWIHDVLWTLEPARPRDARAWTSDAALVAAQLIMGDAHVDGPRWAWLVSDARLFSALRWSLGLMLLLGAALLWGRGPSLTDGGARPTSAHDARASGAVRKDDLAEKGDAIRGPVP
jgi:hypothetical protein